MIVKFFETRIAQLADWRQAITRVREVYSAIHNRKPNIFEPRRYTEKMQWRKLFDANPIYPVLCDKLAVRDFIAERVGESYHVPVLWTGLPADIPFDTIEPPYVIKSNHASGQWFMITERDSIDAPAIREATAAWLAQPYGVAAEEAAYWEVPPKLFIERMLLNDAGARPEEFRIFLFHGKTAFIQTVVIENDLVRHGAFFTPQWVRRNWHFTQERPNVFPRPERLGEMIRIAEILGRGFDHLRVDFFDDGHALFLGELTLYSWSGLGAFKPDEADFELGSHWRLRSPLLRALSAMLLRRRAIA